MQGGQGCSGQTAPGAHCPGQTDIEYQTEFTMWAIAASPIIVATNILNMTDIMTTVLLNADMIAVHQDAAAIAGDRRGFTNDPGCPAGYCQIWSRQLANGDWAGVMYNRDTVPHNITMPIALVNPAWAGATVSAYDLWQHASVGNLTGTYAGLVQGHGVIALRLSPIAL